MRIIEVPFTKGNMFNIYTNIGNTECGYISIDKSGKIFFYPKQPCFSVEFLETIIKEIKRKFNKKKIITEKEGNTK